MTRSAVPPHLPDALRYFAWKMAKDPEAYTQEEGQLMDRALRSCPGITDIDRVWVLWRYVADLRGWLTDKEMVCHKGHYVYPKKAVESPALP